MEEFEKALKDMPGTLQETLLTFYEEMKTLSSRILDIESKGTLTTACDLPGNGELCLAEETTESGGKDGISRSAN